MFQGAKVEHFACVHIQVWQSLHSVITHEQYPRLMVYSLRKEIIKIITIPGCIANNHFVHLIPWKKDIELPKTKTKFYFSKTRAIEFRPNS